MLWNILDVRFGERFIITLLVLNSTSQCHRAMFTSPFGITIKGLSKLKDKTKY
jgi:hypothetical protein